jgi:hypothetical protein
MQNHLRLIGITSSLFALSLFAATGCGSDNKKSSSTGGTGGTHTGGTGGSISGGTGGTATGGSTSGGTGGTAQAGNGGAGGAESYLTCTASTDWAASVGKDCEDFCVGATGFVQVCAETTVAIADVEACEDTCNGWTEAQLCCRIAHLGFAAMAVGAGGASNPDIQMHCSHAVGMLNTCQ